MPISLMVIKNAGGKTSFVDYIANFPELLEIFPYIGLIDLIERTRSIEP